MKTIAVVPARSALQGWAPEGFQLDTACGFVERVAEMSFSAWLLWTRRPKTGCSHPKPKRHCSQLLRFLDSPTGCEEQEGRQRCATYKIEEEKRETRMQELNCKP